MQWSLFGPDAALFQIDEAGTLPLIGALDYEAPASAAESNDYDLTVVATDDGKPPVSQQIEVGRHRCRRKRRACGHPCPSR